MPSDIPQLNILTPNSQLCILFNIRRFLRISDADWTNGNFEGPEKCVCTRERLITTSIETGQYKYTSLNLPSELNHGLFRTNHPMKLVFQIIHRLPLTH